MPELLDEEMTGVRLTTNWLDKLAWFFIVWSAAYLSAYFILPVEPSLVQFPVADSFQLSHEAQNNVLVKLADAVISNQRKVVASYLVLNLVIMLLGYGLLHRKKSLRGPFIMTLYLTIIFHLLKWVVLVVYLKVHGIDAVTSEEILEALKRSVRVFLYIYTGYIILLWFGFRWIARRLHSPQVNAEFEESPEGA